MAKKDYRPEKPAATDNPFAALSALGNLPPAPDHVPDAPEEDDLTAPSSDKRAPLRIYLDRKQRKGKEATIITGFSAPEDTLQRLAKQLKVSCGVGGSVKDGEIILQGNHRDRVFRQLNALGYRNVKKAGG